MIKRFLFVFLFALPGHKVSSETQGVSFDLTRVIFERLGFSVHIDVAKTERQRRLGLMDRESLALDHGMLFIFEQSSIQRVWMKRTLIPLDVIFISAQGIVVSYAKNLQPCRSKDCDIYNSAEHAKYMLEVNEGVIDREKIEIGEKVMLR